MKRILIMILLLGAFACWQCSKSEDAATPTTTVVTDGDVPLAEEVTGTASPADATATSAPADATATK